MKRLKAFLNSLRLSQKLTLAVLVMVLAPITLFFAFLFSTTQSLIAEDKTREIEQGLLRIQAEVEKTVDLCTMTAQVFENNAALRKILLAASRDETFDSSELLTFYREDIASLERLINANPYLYQVRVFYESETLPEMMPILYRAERMRMLSWAKDGAYSIGWQYDYSDDIYPPAVVNATPHLMSLVIDIGDFEAGNLGILEVAVRMDEIIPALFDGETDSQNALVTNDGEWVFSGDSESFWARYRQPILSRYEKLPTELGTISMPIDGETAWVTFVPIRQIGGTYIVVTPPGEVAGHLQQFRGWYLCGMAVLLLLLSLTIHIIVRRMLRRLTMVFDAIVAVKQEDLYAVVPVLGEDEVGQLGNRLNRMMERIVGLMEENVRRQVLAKNFEIRALQSQINAHFIYNVLESIKMTAVVGEQYELADAIQSLGELLRYSMRWNTNTATLAEELGNIENYLRLINLRFDYQISLRNDISPELLHMTLPKMTLQPIVENAVVHGIAELAHDTCIDVVANAANGVVTITLTDYGTGIGGEQLEKLNRNLAEDWEQEAGKNIGLKNVRDRIVMEYGSEYGIEIQSRLGEFTRIIIHLPDSAEERGDLRPTQEEVGF